MAQSKRKFYRTVIKVEILSEEPYPESADMHQVANDIDDGDCSGQAITIVENQVVSGKRMVKLLENQGSDPEFFQLDENGNDLED